MLARIGIMQALRAAKPTEPPAPRRKAAKRYRVPRTRPSKYEMAHTPANKLHLEWLLGQRLGDSQMATVNVS
jgi:hypothetical protein